ncbi:tetratricopeptide (TPR) repeat protein [Actinoplanes tereljensis]|uniref:Tetratricopeptide repeat protein n=1 Tax=Paractinoplanes tereljensis TaxID=571912 RepID=A0A919NEW1_9ACTN|nr:tetratricopeptide repeat protein [Actinoplanes tereljensis]GIF17304.1 hypothetical protein Ate02nite_00340 [Actinoplanes tereljensis]
MQDDALVEQAARLCEVRRESEAAALVAQVLARDPHHVPAWLVLARARLLADDPAGALHAARTAAGLEPGHPAALALVGLAHSDLGRPGEAAAALRQAVAIDPGDAEWHRLLAAVLTADGQSRREALAAARTALELAPDWGAAHVTYGSVLLTGRKIGPAREAFRRALALDPQDASAHHELARADALGRNHYAGGQLARAADGFARTLALDPHEQLAHENLERTLRVFVLRTAVLQMFLALNVARMTNQHHLGLAQLLAVAGVLAPGLYAYSFVRRLSPALRDYLRGMLATTRMRIVQALAATGLAALLVATVLPTWLTLLGALASVSAAIIVKLDADPPSTQLRRTARGFALAAAALVTLLALSVWLLGLSPEVAVILGLLPVLPGYLTWKLIRWRQRVSRAKVAR